jgi:hypothetical protein
LGVREVEDEEVDDVMVFGVLVAVEDGLEASDVLRGGEDGGFCAMGSEESSYVYHGN